MKGILLFTALLIIGPSFLSAQKAESTSTNDGLLAPVIESFLTGRKPDGVSAFEKLKKDMAPAVYSEVQKSWEPLSTAYWILSDYFKAPYNAAWLFESCCRQPNSALSKVDYLTVDAFCRMQPREDCPYLSISEHAQRIADNKEAPIAVSAMGIYQKVQQLLSEAEGNLQTLDVSYENEFTTDIWAFIYLNRFYAYKLLGAVELQKFRVLSYDKKEHQRQSVDALTRAAIYWKMYVEILNQQPDSSVWFNRLAKDEFDLIYRWVLDDIIIAKGAI